MLLDGEELVGAKQNRAVNLSMLIPAQTITRIPVSCAEQGRWAQTSSQFRTEGRALYASGRGAKTTHVTESLRTTGTRRSRQGEVWEDIRGKSARMGSRSDTDAMAGLYEDYQDQLSAFSQAFTPLQNQVGALFASDGQIRGIELFDFPATWRRHYPKLVRSYALDAIENPAGSAQPLVPDWRSPRRRSPPIRPSVRAWTSG